MLDATPNKIPGDAYDRSRHRSLFHGVMGELESVSLWFPFTLNVKSSCASSSV